jgi:hypothetical protein
MVAEVDAMPGGYVCSASFKDALGPGDAVRQVAAGDRAIRKLHSKQQRAFYAAHAPEGLAMDDLSVLGPVNVMKLKFTPKGSAGGWWPSCGCTRMGSGSWSCRPNAHQGRASRSADGWVLPAPGPVHPVGREADQDRRRLRHLPPAPARHHLPAVRDPDVRAALHPRSRPVRMGLVLGRHRRPPRHRALGRRRHPAKPEGRPARRSAPGRERPRSPRACPCPHGQDHPSIRTSVRLASALPDVRQSGSSSSAEQDGPNSSRPSAVRGGCSPGSWSLGAVAATQDARLAAVHPLWVMPVPPHVGRLAGGGLSGGAVRTRR